MSKPLADPCLVMNPAGLEKYMPMPPVSTSSARFPDLSSMRVCLYRLPPSEVTLPATENLRITVQLSARSARLEREFGGETRVVEPSLDSVNINPAYQPVHWRWDNFIEILQIQLRRDFVTALAIDHEIDVESLMRLEKLDMHDALLAQLARELAGILEDRHQGVDAEYLDSLATFTALHLSRNYCQQEMERWNEAPKLRSPDFSRVVEYIHSNLEKDLRVEQIARMVSLSSFYFIRLFKSQFGKTPHQYILECRINLAKELLRDTYLPISDISLRSGFSTQSHFTSAFRQNTGVSPRIYRQNETKGAASRN